LVISSRAFFFDSSNDIFPAIAYPPTCSSAGAIFCDPLEEIVKGMMKSFVLPRKQLKLGTLTWFETYVLEVLITVIRGGQVLTDQCIRTWGKRKAKSPILIRD
jgi:hypothetical protein